MLHYTAMHSNNIRVGEADTVIELENPKVHFEEGRTIDMRVAQSHSIR